MITPAGDGLFIAAGRKADLPMFQPILVQIVGCDK